MRNEAAERLRRYFASLTDEALAEQYAEGPDGFRDAATWAVVDDEYRKRLLGESPAMVETVIARVVQLLEPGGDPLAIESRLLRLGVDAGRVRSVVDDLFGDRSEAVVPGAMWGLKHGAGANKVLNRMVQGGVDPGKARALVGEFLTNRGAFQIAVGLGLAAWTSLEAGPRWLIWLGAGLALIGAYTRVRAHNVLRGIGQRSESMPAPPVPATDRPQATRVADNTTPRRGRSPVPESRESGSSGLWKLLVSGLGLLILARIAWVIVHQGW